MGGLWQTTLSLLLKSRASRGAELSPCCCCCPGRPYTMRSLCRVALLLGLAALSEADEVKAGENDHVTRIDKLMEQAGNVADFDHVLTLKLPASYDYFCFHENSMNASTKHATPLRGLFFVYAIGSEANTDVKFVILGPDAGARHAIQEHMGDMGGMGGHHPDHMGDHMGGHEDQYAQHQGSPVIIEDSKVYEDEFMFTHSGQDGAFDLKATVKGDYRFCFLNPVSEKLITFALNAQLDQINAFLSNDHLDPLSESLKNVWRRLMHLQKEQVYGHKVEQQHRNLVEASLDYITYLTISELIILITCCIGQICFIQTLFSSKDGGSVI